MSEVADKVKKIIVEKLGVDENEVTPAAEFTKDLGADSLDTVELIMEFEKDQGLGSQNRNSNGTLPRSRPGRVFCITQEAGDSYLSFLRNLKQTTQKWNLNV